MAKIWASKDRLPKKWQNLSFFAILRSSTFRVHNIIVEHVFPINFFYAFTVPGSILRHLGEFGKIRLLPGENTRFLAEGGQNGYLKDGL
jgi:hypothetical protein